MPISTEDQLAIMDLVARHNQAFDYGDIEGYADTYADDGIFEPIGGEKVVGREGFLAICKRLVDMGSPVRHVTTTFLIDEIPGHPDEARVRIYFMSLWLNGPEPRIDNTDHYDDLVKKIDGRWRLAHRRLTPDNWHEWREH